MCYYLLFQLDTPVFVWPITNNQMKFTTLNNVRVIVECVCIVIYKFCNYSIEKILPSVG